LRFLYRSEELWIAVLTSLSSKDITVTINKTSDQLYYQMSGIGGSCRRTI